MTIQDTSTSYDPGVLADAQTVADDEEWTACLHLAAATFAAEEADKHRAEIMAMIRGEQKKIEKRYQKAILKAYLVSKHLPGQHDQEEHGNWADHNHKTPHFKEHPVTDPDHLERGQNREYVASGDVGDLVFAAGRLARLPEKLALKHAHNAEHAKLWLGERDWGKKVLLAGAFTGRANPQIASASAAATILQSLANEDSSARKAAKKYYLRYNGLEFNSPGIKRGVMNTRDGQKDVDESGSNGAKRFRNRVYKALAQDIPDDDAARLSKNTGSFPPSEGVIIGGRKQKGKDGTTLYGDAVVRALGRGPDHYLPFSANHMMKAREGGWMLRRRTWGGPTPEDLHLSMAFGAKGTGVVSRHGIYEISWNDEYLGKTGRYGIEHKRILNRYDNLLRQIGTGEMKIDTFDGNGNRTGTRKVSLNHEGYSLALEALKSEFPWYITSVKHEKASKGKKFNAGESGEGGFTLWNNRTEAKDDEVDVSARDRSGLDFFRATQTNSVPQSQPPRNQDGGGRQLPVGRTWEQRRQDEEARRAAARILVMGPGDRGYTPKQRLEERLGEEGGAAAWLASDAGKDYMRSADPEEREMLKGLVANEDGVSFEAASMVRDVLEHKMSDRYTAEGDPTPDALAQIEHDEREEEQRRRQRALRRDQDRNGG